MIARRDRLDSRADLLDHAGGLVAEHDGQGMRVVAGDHVQVAVADAVGRPPHLDLVRTGLEQLDVLDHDRLLRVVQNRRCDTHGTHPLGRISCVVCASAGTFARPADPTRVQLPWPTGSRTVTTRRRADSEMTGETREPHDAADSRAVPHPVLRSITRTRATAAPSSTPCSTTLPSTMISSAASARSAPDGTTAAGSCCNPGFASA